MQVESKDIDIITNDDNSNIHRSHQNTEISIKTEHVAPSLQTTHTEKETIEKKMDIDDSKTRLYVEEGLSKDVKKDILKSDHHHHNEIISPRENFVPRTPDSMTHPYGEHGTRNQILSRSCKHVHKKEPVIGLGTVGLYQNEPREKDIPKEATACINGTLVVGSASHVRKVKEYIEWREKHEDLFSTMKEKSEKERVMARQRHLRAEAKRREKDAHMYSLAVKRMRRRGWSIVGDTPRQVDHTRYNQLKAERDAIRAEYEENKLQKIREASKQRETVSKQLSQCKEETEIQKELLREAARLERDIINSRRKERNIETREKAAVMRTQRDIVRETACECIALEDKYRRDYQTTLREYVHTRTPSPTLASTWSSVVNYSSRDWRNTFKSPLRTLQNASDSTYRKRWVEKLQEERRAMGRTEVEFIRRYRTGNGRENYYNNNLTRAQGLRGEREILWERKQRQEAEMIRIYQSFRRQEEEERKKRQDYFSALREKKKELAAQQRRHLEEEEMLLHTLEEQHLKQLQERAANIKNHQSRSPRIQTPSPSVKENDE